MVYGSNFDIRFLSRHLTDKPRRRYNTTYKASRAAFSPSLIFILMSETSSRVEKEDNSNKKNLFMEKTFQVLKSIIESWQAITVMVWLLYYLDLIMHSASFVCLSYAHNWRVWERKKVHQFIFFFWIAQVGRVFKPFFQNFWQLFGDFSKCGFQREQKGTQRCI